MRLLQKSLANYFCRHPREGGEPENLFNNWIPDKALGNDKLKLLQEAHLKTFYYLILPTHNRHIIRLRIHEDIRDTPISHQPVF